MRIVVKKPFHYDRRPNRAVFHKLKPTDGKPITVIREVGLAAIAAGAAVEYNSNSKSTEAADGARTD